MAKTPGRTAVLIRMSDAQKAVLEREAKKAGCSMNDVVLEFITWLDRLPPGHKFKIVGPDEMKPVTPPTQTEQIPGQTQLPAGTPPMPTTQPTRFPSGRTITT